MYSVVEINGHQYRVQAGDVIDVEKLEGKEGSELTFDQVLFVGGKNPIVGAPVVAGAKVTGLVKRQARSRKVIVFRRKVGKWEKKNGHRQHYTGLFITSVDDGKGNVEKAVAPKQKTSTEQSE